MECKECLANLSEYLDRRLDPAAVLAFESHTSRCVDCSERLQDHKLLGSLMTGKFAEVEPPRDRMWAAIQAQLPAHVPAQESWFVRAIRNTFANGFVLAPIPVALLLVALYWGQARTPNAEPQVAVKSISGTAQHGTPEQAIQPNQQRWDHIKSGFTKAARSVRDAHRQR